MLVGTKRISKLEEKNIMRGNIIICGGPRCGTTSLFRYLGYHPQIIISNKKEMNYFMGGSYTKNQFKKNNATIADYCNLFKDYGPNKWSLEASPLYMHPSVMEIVAERISTVLPAAKLIFILRDPLKRLLSQYLSEKIKRSRVTKDSSFNSYVNSCLTYDDKIISDKSERARVILNFEGLDLGCYAITLTKYLEYFDPKQIFVGFSEDFFNDPKVTVQKICHFIGVDSTVYDFFQFTVENKQINPKNKLLYKLALNVNQFAEPVLNKFPRIKNQIREIHNQINSGSNNTIEMSIDVKTSEQLFEFFTPQNRLLITLLSNVWKIKIFPSWLEKSLTNN